MNVLLTGGAGYIASHTAVALAAEGHRVVCLDNLSNSRADMVRRVGDIVGHAIPLIIADIRDTDAMQQTIRDHDITAVIHFAGLKAVGESVSQPISYYENNVHGTLALLKAMAACNVKTLVFSSSATVYGQPQRLPLDESHPTSATNPYGRTKLMVEEMLADVAHADPDWRIAVLRYFNPVGAHPSGLIGEDPNGIPNNLMPLVSRAASGRLKTLSVYGNDYDTPDGTGVRDYIHVTDLAQGHVSGLKTICQSDTPITTWNLGTGQGHSVLEVIAAFERVNGVSVPYQIAERRPGDVAACYACVDKARRELGWQATLGLDEMVGSAWRFEQMRNQFSS
ncbi:MAG: UDP-glucose 4-epimerase GalE [Porphyrobacter sp.]|jgi:UDP-glucose 4-epimerase|nr:UDP-glucose 4-epimerase GalE [Porphyrobacter sp.]